MSGRYRRKIIEPPPAGPTATAEKQAQTSGQRSCSGKDSTAADRKQVPHTSESPSKKTPFLMKTGEKVQIKRKLVSDPSQQLHPASAGIKRRGCRPKDQAQNEPIRVLETVFGRFFSKSKSTEKGQTFKRKESSTSRTELLSLQEQNRLTIEMFETFVAEHPGRSDANRIKGKQLPLAYTLQALLSTLLENDQLKRELQGIRAAGGRFQEPGTSMNDVAVPFGFSPMESIENADQYYSPESTNRTNFDADSSMRRISGSSGQDSHIGTSTIVESSEGDQDTTNSSDGQVQWNAPEQVSGSYQALVSHERPNESEYAGQQANFSRSGQMIEHGGPLNHSGFTWEQEQTSLQQGYLSGQRDDNQALYPANNSVMQSMLSPNYYDVSNTNSLFNQGEVNLPIVLNNFDTGPTHGATVGAADPCFGLPISELWSTPNSLDANSVASGYGQFSSRTTMDSLHHQGYQGQTYQPQSGQGYIAFNETHCPRQQTARGHAKSRGFDTPLGASSSSFGTGDVASGETPNQRL